LVRPTLLSYGLVTAILVTFLSYRNDRKLRPVVMGILCFCIGIALGLWFNYLRFGSIVEFGYSGQMCPDPAVNYSTEFGYPFRYEPFFSAAKELLGQIFFYNWWQSHTFRQREFDFVVFNASHLFLLGVGLILFILILKSKFNHSKPNNDPSRMILYFMSWGFINTGMLFCFYLYAPWLNSRYLCDFSAAFHSVIIGTVLIGLSSKGFGGRYKRGSKILLVSFIVLTIPFFYFNGSRFLKFKYQPYKRHHYMWIDSKENVQKMVNSFYSRISLNPDIPETFYCGQRYFIPGLKYQFTGWEIEHDCSVGATTVFFMPARPCLTISYSIDDQQALPPVKVKRGLEFLRLINSKVIGKDVKTPYMKRVTQSFCSDKAEGQALAFYNIGWVRDTELNNNALPIKLNWVSVSSEKMRSSKD